MAQYKNGEIEREKLKKILDKAKKNYARCAFEKYEEEHKKGKIKGVIV